MADQVTASLGAESLSCTDAKLVRFAHKWIINHFSFHLEDEESAKPYMKSAKFSPATNEQMKFTLRLYPRNKEDSEEFLGVHVLMDSADKEEVTVQCKVSLIGEDGEKHETMESQFKFTAGKKRGWHKFITRERVLDAHNGLLPNDKLTIFCEMSYLTESSTVKGPAHTLAALALTSEEQHLKEIGSLLESGRFSDITLTVKDKEYRLHKNILSTRCSFFATMFNQQSTDGEQKEDNLVDISNYSVEVFDHLIKYIYTGKIDKAIDNVAAELLVVADKFGLACLKSICEEMLCLKLTVDNVIEMLVLANQYNAAQLKTCALDYISMNVTSVVEGANWKGLIDTHPKLYQEALLPLLPKISRPVSLNSQTAPNKKCKKAPYKPTIKRGIYMAGKMRRKA